MKGLLGYIEGSWTMAHMSHGRNCLGVGYILPDRHGTWKRVLYRLLSSVKGSFSGSTFVWGSVYRDHIGSLLKGYLALDGEYLQRLI